MRQVPAALRQGAFGCLGSGRPHVLHLSTFVGVIQLGFGIPAAGWIQVLPHSELSLSFSTVKWG